MFESIELSNARRSRALLTFGISCLLHVVVIATLVIVPLIYFNVLPQQELLTFLMLPPSPPPPPPPPPPPAPRSVVPPRVVVHNFVAPTAIPRSIPPPVNEPPVIEPEFSQGIAGITGGIVGGIPGGIAGGIPGGLLKQPAVLPPPPPPPPQPVAHTPIKVGGNLEQAKLILKVDPVYPQLARVARVAGPVELEVTVDEDGNVSRVKVVGGNPLLEKSAINAVRQWKFSPTILNGEPVPVVADITVMFRLT